MRLILTFGTDISPIAANLLLEHPHACRQDTEAHRRMHNFWPKRCLRLFLDWDILPDLQANRGVKDLCDFSTAFFEVVYSSCT